MKAKIWFEKALASFKDDFEFRLETLIYNITEKIAERMRQKKISRIQFAQILDITPPAVTKILNGNSNFTLKTLLTISDALQMDLNVTFEKKRPARFEIIDTSIVNLDIISSLREKTVTVGESLAPSYIEMEDAYPQSSVTWADAA